MAASPVNEPIFLRLALSHKVLSPLRTVFISKPANISSAFLGAFNNAVNICFGSWRDSTKSSAKDGKIAAKDPAESMHLTMICDKKLFKSSPCLFAFGINIPPLRIVEAGVAAVKAARNKTAPSKAGFVALSSESF